MQRQSREPVSRGMATILQATLEEMLPEGSLRAQLSKPGRGMGKGQTPAKSSVGNMHGVAAVPSLVELDLHAFERDFELIDMVAREVRPRPARGRPPLPCNSTSQGLSCVSMTWRAICG